MAASGDKSIASSSCLRNFVRLVFVFLATTLGTPFTPLIQAQPVAPELIPFTAPPDLSRVHFYLLTVDVGASVYDNFGHTALRVVDENTGTDTVFNWGVFDVSAGPVAFSYNFFKGIMRYRLATSTPALEFDAYRNQQRTVWQDRINLTGPQKERLYRRLLWNLEPDNLSYDYHYFFDNCTTRVRDYLDEALGGQIRDYYSGVTENTFRDQVRAHYESIAVIRVSLDVLMNSNIDRPVTAWENMYLPISLREQLATIPSQVAENGRRLMLLSDQQVLMRFPPPRAQTDGYLVALLVLLTPVLFLSFMLKRIPRSNLAGRSRFSLKVPVLSYPLLGLLGLLTSVFSGVLGCLMLGSWIISAHQDLHHNVNLLLFWPTDLLAVPVAAHWLLVRGPWPLTRKSATLANYYVLARVLAMLVYAVLAVFGLVEQTITSIAVFVLPGFLLFTLMMWVVGFESAKPKNLFS